MFHKRQNENVHFHSLNVVLKSETRLLCSNLWNRICFFETIDSGKTVSDWDKCEERYSCSTLHFSLMPCVYSYLYSFCTIHYYFPLIYNHCTHQQHFSNLTFTWNISLVYCWNFPFSREWYINAFGKTGAKLWQHVLYIGDWILQIWLSFWKN